jgi:hypothetical protein
MIIGGPDRRLYDDVQATDWLSIMSRNNEPGMQAQVLCRSGRHDIRRPPECEDVLHVAIVLPSLAGNDMVHICQFTLIDVRSAELVFLQESQKNGIVPIELRADRLVKVRILCSLPFLAPVLDKPVVLNLNHFAPLIVGEPDPRDRKAFERLEFETDSIGWAFRELLNHRVQRWAILGPREGLTVLVPEETEMRRPGQGQRLELDRQNRLDNRWVIKVRQMLWTGRHRVLPTQDMIRKICSASWRCCMPAR